MSRNTHLAQLITQANDLLHKKFDLMLPATPDTVLQQVARDLDAKLDQLEQYGAVSYGETGFVLVGGAK